MMFSRTLSMRAPGLRPGPTMCGFLAVAAGSLSPVTASVEFLGSYGCHDYYRETTPMTFEEARAAAASLGGSLVAINDEAEQAWLNSLVGFSPYYWIGLSDEVQEGVFLWDSGEELAFTYWNPGQPDNNNGEEECAGLNWRNAGRWNDFRCDNRWQSIIETPSASDCGNRALHFNGGDFAWVEHGPAFDELEDRDAVTIEAWIRIEGYFNELFAVLNKYELTGDRGWELIYNHSEQRLIFLGVRSSVTWDPLPNKWYHVAVAYDRSESSMVFFVDGAPISAVSTSADIPDTDDEPMYLGYNPSGPDEFTRGTLDEVRLWNRARSTDEIAALYWQPLNGDEDGLVGYWRIDEGGGSRFRDHSISSNHGLLAGGIQRPTWAYGAPLEPSDGPECDAIQRLKVKCNRATLLASVKSSLAEGTQLTLEDDGERRVVTINGRGKGKAKWSDQYGVHTVSVVECPEHSGQADCG